MSDRLRFWVFLAAGAVLGAGLLYGMDGLPSFGDYQGPYGLVINAVAVSERHVTNMPSAVNFDYRGFDTLGEEYILFAAVTGMALLLRNARGEIEDEPRSFAADRQAPPHSDAVGWVGLLLTGTTILFGAYVVIHAHLTPGGGFQGGTILGSALLLVYLTVDYRTFKVLNPKAWIEAAEAVGAGGYAVICVASLIAGGAFLSNFLSLGTTGHLFSAGIIPVINLMVGLEVAGGFAVLFAEFLKDTRKPRQERGP